MPWERQSLAWPRERGREVPWNPPPNVCFSFSLECLNGWKMVQQESEVSPVILSMFACLPCRAIKNTHHPCMHAKWKNMPWVRPGVVKLQSGQVKGKRVCGGKHGAAWGKVLRRNCLAQSLLLSHGSSPMSFCLFFSAVVNACRPGLSVPPKHGYRGTKGDRAPPTPRMPCLSACLPLPALAGLWGRLGQTRSANSLPVACQLAAYRAFTLSCP